MALVAAIRYEPLDRENLLADPLHLFQRWFDDAVSAGLPDPSALTLATATKAGRPSARVVLHKGLADGGFVFFTNYGSRKARELDANPYAAMVFLWYPLQRQIRVEGRVKRVPRAESEEYFASRPRDAQLGAWASRQSSRLPDREALERSLERARARFEGRPVPCPDGWGGYRLVPARIEFWQGREHRLHDRFLYERGSGARARWKITRLAP
jgi:pyridoxamine 5'-phosphate oxidase